MFTKQSPTLKGSRIAPASLGIDEHPLLRVLIAQATRRGETLAALARQLGVSYIRLAQWRRGEANLSNARRPVLEAAARYLDVPALYVLVMVGTVKLSDLSPPSVEQGLVRVTRDIERMKRDPKFSGFVPASLATAEPSIREFVVLLWRELSGESETSANRAYQWMRTVELAAMGHEQAQKELALFEKQGGIDKRSF